MVNVDEKIKRVIAVAAVFDFLRLAHLFSPGVRAELP